MKCRACGRDGADSSGYHQSCFIDAVKSRTGKSGSKTTFYSTHTKQQTLDEEAAEKENEHRSQDQQDRFDKQARDRKKSEEAWKQFFQFFQGSSNRQYTVGVDPAVAKSDKSSLMVEIDANRIKQLLMLCHPDKHSNSELSTEVTKWLTGIREILTPKKKQV